MSDDVEERRLRIQLLGDFRLSYGHELVTEVDTPRLQSLLAYLLLHRDAPQSRRRVAFLFWSDSSEGQALTNLRNLLYHLRQRLPDPERFLDVDRSTLRWRVESPFDLDVARFEGAVERARGALGGDAPDAASARRALEEAMDAYGGDLLPDCYDDWAAGERQRLSQAFEWGAERLTVLLEDQQAYREAIQLAERLLRHDPLREGPYRRLMRLRALVGDRAGALRTYHRCVTVLEQELGTEPSASTREVYERLLAADEEPPSPDVRPGRRATESPLVGREAAWSALRSAWKMASRGGARMALISGEAGIGKSRLAEELAHWGRRQGLVTATARCYATEGELAYAPVAAWLRQLPRAELERVWLAEVARILPELAVADPELPVSGSLGEPWRRRRFFEALARATVAANRPLLLVIDALQWCDQSTLDWLHYLLRFEAAERLLVVGTYRPDAMRPEHRLKSLLHDLRHDDCLTEIELAPLNERETAELAQNLTERELGPNLLACLYGETEGNPLFVVETVRAGLPDDVQEGPSGRFVCLPRPLPSRMRDALMARVEQLSPLARGVAELAAVFGQDFTFEALMQGSRAAEERLVRGLDELWQRRIIREQGEDGYDFTHDKLREVIYAELSEARRRLLHRRVASTLEANHNGDVDAVAARLAAHYERGGEREKARAYYARAAEMAEGMEQREEAARCRDRAAAVAEG